MSSVIQYTCLLTVMIGLIIITCTHELWREILEWTETPHLMFNIQIFFFFCGHTNGMCKLRRQRSNLCHSINPTAITTLDP